MMFDAESWVRRHVFPSRGAGRAARIGAEVELLAFDPDTRRPAHVERLVAFVRGWTARRGGQTITSAKAGQRIVMPDGGGFAIEPGGQLEYASPPFDAPSALLRCLDEVLLPLTEDAADAGIELAGFGIDPYNARDAAPLQIPAERYRRMDAYFETIGHAGRRMMRQTAALQLNVDPAGPPPIAWRALNAAAPCFTALCANSADYGGGPTGFVSYRAETWRRADPLRTGLFTTDADAALKYARFGIEAPVMRPLDGEYRPFRDWLPVLPDPETAWADHLSTLFPEVRPRGFYEIRSMDAQPVDRLRLPVLLASLALDARGTAEAEELLGDPDPVLLQLAGRYGVAFPRLQTMARELVAIAIRAGERLGPGRFDPRDLARAAEEADAALGAPV